MMILKKPKVALIGAKSDPRVATQNFGRIGGDDVFGTRV